MELENIIQELIQRFAEPLPEFYKRRIIFWHDEDMEFADYLEEINLPNAKIAVLTGTNNFKVKKLLNADDTESNYLVYCPLTYNTPEDNWLFDMELYSEEYHTDMISKQMEEMHLPSTPALRKQLKEYHKFFNAKSRRQKIANLNMSIASPKQLQLAIMGTICGLKKITPSAIIKQVLSEGTDNDTNPVYLDFVTYNADEIFWKLIEQGTGYTADKPQISDLAAHILMTAVTRTIRTEFLVGLDNNISVAHQAYCYEFVSDWLHSDDNSKILEIADTVDNMLCLSKKFTKLDIDDLISTEIFSCIHEIILIKAMTFIINDTIDIDTLNAIVEKRRTCIGFIDFEDYYNGIQQIANMQQFFKEHSGGFHTVEPQKIWNKYTKDYYKMDTYYRKFHIYYGRSLKNYRSDLHDLFSLVMEKAEGLYKTWFLGLLGNNWTESGENNLAELGYIPGIKRQTDFYKDRIKNSDTRVFVIISDALRYEVAAELAEKLKRETQSKVSLESMQGVFPTITEFGMAALLPHKKLNVELHNDILKVIADGKYTDSNYRDKILKSANPNSLAIQYSEIVGMKRQERSSYVKGKEVVYIYHNTIDDAGHTNDSMVFPSCDNTIDEIKNLVRIIVNDFGATNIIITADHGFLYTYSPLTENDKIDKTSFANSTIKYGRRYAIIKKGTNPQYLMPINFLDGEKENTRIKMNGGGLNFVHGGASLQEMVVPIIEYHFLRNQNKEYQRNKSKYDTKPVEIALLSTEHKISNMIFSLSFYQTEPVKATREAATYHIYFTDSVGKPVSDVQKIIADKKNKNVQERTFRCNFNLKSLKFDKTETYYLVIATDKNLPVERIEFQIDIAFDVDNFDFFSLND